MSSTYRKNGKADPSPTNDAFCAEGSLRRGDHWSSAEKHYGEQIFAKQGYRKFVREDALSLMFRHGTKGHTMRPHIPSKLGVCTHYP